MRFYDISVALSEDLPGFPGDPPVLLQPAGQAFALTELSLGSHSGTHMDLPGHLGLPGETAATLPPERLIGPCRVWDLSPWPGPIDAGLLSRCPLPEEGRVLLRTGNSRLWRRSGFCSEYRSLTADGAEWLVAQGLQLLGMDYLSVEKADGDGSVHRLLLEAGIVVLEGLDLDRVPEGRYELICLPLKLAVADGAPCRAVLRCLEIP